MQGYLALLRYAGTAVEMLYVQRLSIRFHCASSYNTIFQQTVSTIFWISKIHSIFWYLYQNINAACISLVIHFSCANLSEVAFQELIVSHVHVHIYSY